MELSFVRSSTTHGVTITYDNVFGLHTVSVGRHFGVAIYVSNPIRTNCRNDKNLKQSTVEYFLFIFYFFIKLIYKCFCILRTHHSSQKAHWSVLISFPFSPGIHSIKFLNERQKSECHSVLIFMKSFFFLEWILISF